MPLFIIALQSSIYWRLFMFENNEIKMTVSKAIYFLPLPNILIVFIFYMVSLLVSLFSPKKQTLLELIFGMTPILFKNVDNVNSLVNSNINKDII